MNIAQKILTGVAIAGFIATLFQAPWSANPLSDGTPTLPGGNYNDTVWSNPANHHLNLAVLLVEWFAIAVVYIAAMFLLKSRHESPKNPQTASS